MDRRALLALLGFSMGMTLAVNTASAQTPPSPAPDTTPAPSVAQATPAPPSVAVPPAPVVSEPISREARLEEEVQQLKAMVNQLSTQMQRMSSAGAAVSPGSSPSGGPNPGGMNSANPFVLPSRSGGLNAPGQSLPPNPPVLDRFNSPATLENRPGSVKFGPGFEIRTDDDEFFLQFHDLTQFDYRGFQQGSQSPVKDSFTFPRQWWMFSGRVTKQWGYFLSFQQAVDTMNGLDIFVDYNYSPKFSLRMGRFKTPFTYEFLVEPIQGLMTGERSLFFNNFGQNRDEGIMAYGRLFDNKFDYAGGIFNGARNGYIDPNNSKSISWFINYRPFADEENTLLENFNIGGSVFAAQGLNNTPVPATFRTNIATTGNSAVGIPFLTLNSNVHETGSRALWDLHMAYFYQSLAVIAEWQSGYQDYSLTSNITQRTHLPIQSFYVQAGYLLTGETRSSIGIVKPNHPFNLSNEGERGYGAWEIVGRYNYLGIGNQVFTNGLADPNLYTNSVSQTDLGVNWHATQYIKVYLDWQHSVFGSPVTYAPGKSQLTSDLFWIRLQLFF